MLSHVLRFVRDDLESERAVLGRLFGAEITVTLDFSQHRSVLRSGVVPVRRGDVTSQLFVCCRSEPVCLGLQRGKLIPGCLWSWLMHYSHLCRLSAPLCCWVERRTSGPGAQYWRKNSHPKARKAEDLVQPNKSDWLLRKASPARCAAVTQSSLESGRWLLALLFL